MQKIQYKKAKKAFDKIEKPQWFDLIEEEDFRKIITTREESINIDTGNNQVYIKTEYNITSSYPKTRLEINMNPVYECDITSLIDNETEAWGYQSYKTPSQIKIAAELQELMRALPKYMQAELNNQYVPDYTIEKKSANMKTNDGAINIQGDTINFNHIHKGTSQINEEQMYEILSLDMAKTLAEHAYKIPAINNRLVNEIQAHEANQTKLVEKYIDKKILHEEYDTVQILHKAGIRNKVIFNSAFNKEDFIDTVWQDSGYTENDIIKAYECMRIPDLGKTKIGEFVL